MSTTKHRQYGIFRDGKFLDYLGTRYTRRQAHEWATETCMGAREYHELENLRARWGACYRAGIRVRPVTVEATR